MNRNCKNSFDTIIGSATAYRSAVAAVLDSFSKKEQQAREDSKMYKDENSRYKTALESLTAEARAQLDRKREEFTDAVANEVETLHKEMLSLAAERTNPAYCDLLRCFADFNIQPAKTQIEGLLQMNSGNILGLDMLNNALKKTGSTFRIENTGFAELEKDLENLSRLGELAKNYSPIENHSQLCKLYVGTPRLGANGADTGSSWDSVSLIVQRGSFENAIKSLDEMSKRWSSTAPSITQLKDYKDTEDTSAADLFLSDRKDASAHIEKNSSGVEQARNIGKAKAEANSKNAEVLNIYSK